LLSFAILNHSSRYDGELNEPRGDDKGGPTVDVGSSLSDDQPDRLLGQGRAAVGTRCAGEERPKHPDEKIGDTYSDLGATVADNVDQNLGVHAFFGSTPLEQVMIDTSTTTTYYIDYVATDSAGNTATSHPDGYCRKLSPRAKCPARLPVYHQLQADMTVLKI
jgi:hypothetical protein